MKVFVFDSSKCNGCYGCQLACKDEHCDNDWSPISLPQPDTGQFWCHLEEVVHGQVPKVRMEYTPKFGGQDSAIADYAPEVMMERADGLRVIDPAKAAGRKDIAEKFEGVFWNEELNVPQACTGCAHLVDEGQLPHCVDVCPTLALRFGDEEEFADEIAVAETFDTGTGKPNVYYVNLPHLFISGDVWDPEADEVIIGAKATLTCPDGSVVEEQTNVFGDFWFRKLDPGEYTVRVEADGYKPAEKAVALDKSLNVGDFALEKA